MHLKNLTAFLTMLTLLAGMVVGPLGGAREANAQTTQQRARQHDKNNMRNIGLGAGAVAAHEAIKGRGTNALIAGAVGVYAGKKYEDARKAQSRENAQRRRYGYRSGSRSYRKYAKRGNGRKVGYYSRSRNARR